MSTFQRYTANGVDRAFPIPFDYISPDFVKAIVDGEPASGTINAGFFELTTVPQNGSPVWIYRETPVIPLVSFENRTTVTEDSLDLVIRQLSDTIEETRSGFYPDQLDVYPSVPSPDVPTFPTGLVATPVLSTITVRWDRPSFNGYRYSEVWRSATDDFSTAELIGSTFTTQFADVVGYSVSYYYWVRHVNSVDLVGPESPDSVYAETVESEVLDDIVLDVISAPGTGILDQLSFANEYIAILSQQISGNHAHVITVDDRLNDTEGVVIAQDERITSVEADTASLQTDVSGNTSVLNVLDSRVTQTETDLSTVSNAVVAVESSLSSTDSTVSGISSGLTALESRVTTTESGITSVTSDVTSLQNDVTSAEGNISGLTTTVGALSSRVDTVEGGIATQNSAITTLTSDVSDAQSDISGQQTAISGLQTSFSTLDGTVSGHTSDITQLQQDVSTLDVDGNLEAINGLDTRVTANEGAISQQATDITNLTNSLSTTDGNVAATQSGLSSLQSRVDTVEGTVTSQGSQLTSLNSSLTSLQTDVSGNTTEIASNAAATNSLSTRVTNTETAIGTQSSSITSLESDISSLQTDVSGNATAINAVDTRVDTVDGTLTSIASDVSTLTTAVGGNTASITNLSTSVDGLNAQWEVKTDVNDIEGGVGFYNDGTSTKFVVDADVFLFSGAPLVEVVAEDQDPFGAVAMSNGYLALMTLSYDNRHSENQKLWVRFTGAFHGEGTPGYTPPYIIGLRVDYGATTEPVLDITPAVEYENATAGSYYAVRGRFSYDKVVDVPPGANTIVLYATDLPEVTQFSLMRARLMAVKQGVL